MDADFISGLGFGGGDFPERRVADHGGDFLGSVAEGPGAFAAVGEGDVRVGAALEDDRGAGFVEDLAAGSRVGDGLADEEGDGGEGAGGGG